MKNKKTDLIPYEIFSFNLWLFLTIGYYIYMILCIVPNKYFIYYLKIDFLPDPYWYTSIPTHILVSLIFIFVFIKEKELIETIDNPPYKDQYYKELNLKEMKKEIEIDRKEGIVPDAGDLREDIVKYVLNM
jgi:hypothetical protein